MPMWNSPPAVTSSFRKASDQFTLGHLPLFLLVLVVHSNTMRYEYEKVGLGCADFGLKINQLKATKKKKKKQNIRI